MYKSVKNESKKAHKRGPSLEQHVKVLSETIN